MSLQKKRFTYSIIFLVLNVSMYLGRKPTNQNLCCSESNCVWQWTVSWMGWRCIHLLDAFCIVPLCSCSSTSQVNGLVTAEEQACFFIPDVSAKEQFCRAWPYTFREQLAPGKQWDIGSGRKRGSFRDVKSQFKHVVQAEHCLVYWRFIYLFGLGFAKSTAEFSTPPQFGSNWTSR